MPRRSRRGIVPNTRPSGRAGRRASPIGSLVIQQDGRSEFYPEGGPNRLPSRSPNRLPSRSPNRLPLRSTDHRPVWDPPITRREQDGDLESVRGTQAIYLNNGFKNESEGLDLESPKEHNPDGLNQPLSIQPSAAFLKSCIVCGFVGVIVFIVVAMAIIFPIAYLGGNSGDCSLSCLNSGVLNDAACSCTCPAGFTGATCNTTA